MSTISSLASRSGEGFEENAGAYEDLVEELRDRMREARRGGSEKAQQRHEDRGKMLVRDRRQVAAEGHEALPSSAGYTTTSGS